MPFAANPRFDAPTLGEPRHDSPLQLNTTAGDLIADFTDEHARAFANPEWGAAIEWLERGEQPPTFEIAGPRQKIYFPPNEGRAAIVTCGGLCPGLNNVIRAIVMELWYHYGVREIYGAQFGYRGLLPQHLPNAQRLTPEVVHHIHEQGGTILGSSRGDQDIATMVDALVAEDIRMLFTIGGDGTQRGAWAITQEIQRRGLDIAVIGLPKTIDNDLPYTERTFGFLTSVSIASEALFGAHTEAHCAEGGVGLVKVMGRHCGYIAAQAALATGEANFVLIPEQPFELEGPNGLLALLEKRLAARNHALIVLAEGAGQDLIERAAPLGSDASGNQKLSDIGLFLKGAISGYLKERGVEHSVKYIDPSYIIRSVPANAADAVFCLELGHNAVHAAMSGRTGVIVGYAGQRYIHIPMEAAANTVKRLDPNAPLWRAVVESTGQPATMLNG